MDAPLMSNILARGESMVRSDAFLQVELLHEIARARGISDQAIHAACPADILERGPQNWHWVLAMLRLIDPTPLGAAALVLAAG
jgi:hypothetical protein